MAIGIKIGYFVWKYRVHWFSNRWGWANRQVENIMPTLTATAVAPPPSFSSTSVDASFRQFHPVTVDEVTAAVRALPIKAAHSNLCRLHSIKPSWISSLHSWPNCSIDLWRVVSSRKFLKSRTVYHAAPEEGRHGSGRCPTCRSCPSCWSHSWHASCWITSARLACFSASAASVCIPRRPFDRDRRVEGPVGTSCSPATYLHWYCWIYLRPSNRWITTFWSGALKCLMDGLLGMVLQWFQTYLVDRSQCVRTGLSASLLTLIVCGVPQGSVQFPPRCTKYNSPPINGQCTNHCIAIWWSVALRF